MGKLSIVPTPIGNLEDISLRAIRYLKEADIVFAEDTRTSAKLFKHYDIQTPLKAYHMHNEHSKLDQYITLIQQSKMCALISDAGTPGISDPGYLLIREVIANNIPLEVLPGATAFVPALLLSGFPNDSFLFEGFLPLKKGRQTRILGALDSKHTIIWYESPHRLLKLLSQIVEFLGPERQIAVCRELSKIYEECIRGKSIDVLQHYEKHGVKGEIVVIINRV